MIYAAETMIFLAPILILLPTYPKPIFLGSTGALLDQ